MSSVAKGFNCFAEPGVTTRCSEVPPEEGEWEWKVGDVDTPRLDETCLEFPFVIREMSTLGGEESILYAHPVL